MVPVVSNTGFPSSLNPDSSSISGNNNNNNDDDDDTYWWIDIDCDSRLTTNSISIITPGNGSNNIEPIAVIQFDYELVAWY